MQIARDGRIIPRGALVHFGRQLAPQFQRRPAIFADLFRYLIIVRRIGDDRHGLMVLGRAAQHGGTADVDVLDRICQCHIRLGNCGLKGIQVHHHQIDGMDAVLCAGRFMLCIAPQMQQSAVHLGV